MSEEQPDFIEPPMRFDPPIDWWSLSPGERTPILGRLRVFVDELVRRWNLQESVVPACWWRHEPMVQELLALKQYREIAFWEKSPPSTPLDFNYQLKSMVIPRLREEVAATGCTHEHTPAKTQQYVVDGSPAELKYSREMGAWVVELVRLMGDSELDDVEIKQWGEQA